LAAALLTAAGVATAADAGKIVVIAIDGYTPEVAAPLMETDGLPTLRGLAERGVALEFDSFDWDFELRSSHTWETMSTGQPPDREVPGSEDAHYETGGGLEAPFLQEMLAEVGWSIAVIGWPCEDPAAWGDLVVTRDFACAPDDGYGVNWGTTRPAELKEELAPLRVAGVDLADEAIADLVDGDPGGSPENGSIVSGSVLLKEYYARDATLLAATRHVIETRGQPDLLMLFLNGIDECTRSYWGYMDPSGLPKPLDAEATQMFRDLIPRYYERVDRMIGEMIGSLDEGTTIVVCSGYAYRGPLMTKQGLKLGAEMRLNVGSLFAAGPRIRRGGEVDDAHILDIAPSLLALAGAPVPMSMGGFVLTGIIDEEFMRRHLIDYVDDITIN